jgi:hypothetical protein
VQFLVKEFKRDVSCYLWKKEIKSWSLPLLVHVSFYKDISFVKRKYKNNQ